MRTDVLKGMVALVTGGASGIGAAICNGLASSGASVVVVDKKPAAAQSNCRKVSESRGSSMYICADITRKGKAQQLINQCVDRFGALNILVNCAAPSRSRDTIRNLSPSDSISNYKVIIEATVSLTEAAVGQLIVGGIGSVINISSVVGSVVAIDQCSWPYHTSKAGLDHLTRWLAVRLAPSGIRVNAVAPGIIDRDCHPRLSDSLQNRIVIEEVVPLRRAGRGADVADAVVFLASRQAAYINGQILKVDGGLTLNEVFGTALRLREIDQKK